MTSDRAPSVGVEGDIDVSTQPTVLLLGGTGRTGGRVLRQLLGRGIRVRVIVRSGAKLLPDVAGNPTMTVIEGSLLSLSDEELQRHLRGCDAVISCLGHVLTLKGTTPASPKAAEGVVDSVGP